MSPHYKLARVITVCLLALIFEANAAPPLGHPSTDDAFNMMKVPAVKAFPHQGSVLQAIHSNSYTYIQIQSKQHRIWLAAPRIELREGQQIAFPDGAVMQNFYSRKLKRTFEEVIFVRKVEVLPEQT